MFFTKTIVFAKKELHNFVFEAFGRPNVRIEDRLYNLTFEQKRRFFLIRLVAVHVQLVILYLKRSDVRTSEHDFVYFGGGPVPTLVMWAGGSFNITNKTRELVMWAGGRAFNMTN